MLTFGDGPEYGPAEAPNECPRAAIEEVDESTNGGTTVAVIAEEVEVREAEEERSQQNLQRENHGQQMELLLQAAAEEINRNIAYGAMGAIMIRLIHFCLMYFRRIRGFQIYFCRTTVLPKTFEFSFC